MVRIKLNLIYLLFTFIVSIGSSSNVERFVCPRPNNIVNIFNAMDVVFFVGQSHTNNTNVWFFDANIRQFIFIDWLSTLIYVQLILFNKKLNLLTI